MDIRTSFFYNKFIFKSVNALLFVPGKSMCDLAKVLQSKALFRSGKLPVIEEMLSKKKC